MSILFFTGISDSWGWKVVKLSTKNPDLNLFNPSSSGTNKFAVAVSKRVNEL